MTDLVALPRVSDGWTFLYVEHARIERDDHAIVLLDDRGRVPVPVAMLSCVLLGPGCTITHAGVLALAENGCSVVWCGEGQLRFYAAGLGETRSAANLMAQANAWADPGRRQDVVMRMYRMRFDETLEPNLSIEQVRGREGVRVRAAYQRYASEYGVVWRGRNYKTGSWGAADPVNRALSAANACLYGLCHGALVATGFSPGLGFIHTGKALAFVYDVADLYKVDITVPAAFAAASEGATELERRVRRRCRELFRERRLLARIVGDVRRVLGLAPEPVEVYEHREDEAAIASLWDPERGAVRGGRNYADPEESEVEPS